MKKRTILILSLLLAMSVSALWSARRAQHMLSEKLVRLHVIANSDSEADQALKLQVRDSVLAEAERLLGACHTRAEAEAALGESLPRLEAQAGETLRAAGCPDGVKASLSLELYPHREYETFSLPAGEYLSLRLVIGEGAGRNWWCVVFPPLCLAATTEEFELTAAEAGLTEDEIAIIREESGETVVRFKMLEWVNELFQ